MATNETDECEIAYSNPKCPYVTQINISTNSMKNVDKTLTALMGPDGTGLNSGVIHTILLKLDKLEDNQKVQHSWVEKTQNPSTLCQWGQRSHISWLLTPSLDTSNRPLGCF